MTNATVRLQQKWAKADQDEIDAALRALLTLPEGRKYIWWLLQIGKVGLQPFTSNALNTSFNCGELNVGQQVLAHLISVDPAGYVAMMQEQANERSSRDTELRDAQSRANPDTYADTRADSDPDDSDT